MHRALYMTGILLLTLAPCLANGADAVEEAIRMAEEQVANAPQEAPLASGSQAEKSETESPELEQAAYPGVKNLLIRRGGNGEPAISIYYPEVGVASVDEALKKFAEDMAAGYEKELQESYGDSAEKPSSWGSWDETGFFTVSRPNPDVLSVTFNIGYYTGGAHGQLLIAVQNYDLKTGARLELKDLFARPQEAIEILSRLSESKLRESLGPDLEEDMLKSGTAPDPDNFLNLSLQPDGLTVEFQPYQVGPWSIGLQHVEISLQELDPAGPNPAVWPGAASLDR